MDIKQAQLGSIGIYHHSFFPIIFRFLCFITRKERIARKKSRFLNLGQSRVVVCSSLFLDKNIIDPWPPKALLRFKYHPLSLKTSTFPSPIRVYKGSTKNSLGLVHFKLFNANEDWRMNLWHNLILYFYKFPISALTIRKSKKSKHFFSLSL